MKQPKIYSILTSARTGRNHIFYSGWSFSAIDTRTPLYGLVYTLLVIFKLVPPVALYGFNISSAKVQGKFAAILELVNFDVTLN